MFEWNTTTISEFDLMINGTGDSVLSFEFLGLFLFEMEVFMARLSVVQVGAGLYGSQGRIDLEIVDVLR